MGILQSGKEFQHESQRRTASEGAPYAMLAGPFVVRPVS